MTGNRLLDALLGHFAGGGAFFTACGLLGVAVGLRLRAGRRSLDPKSVAAERWSRAGAAVGLTGAAALTFSACPLPRWWYGFVYCAAAWWVFASRPGWSQGWRYGSAGALASLTLWGAGWELTWRIAPAIPPVTERELVVVGDSLTAGVGGEAARWPDLLAERHDIEAVTVAVAGARVHDALDPPGWDIPESGGVVLLELGGNDMLGGTNPGRFRSDLRTLLERLKRRTSERGGTVVAVGLPLPPFHAAYGRAQRAACVEAGVPLIPRRVLADVLFGPDATTDGLHLSPKGHAAMAEAAWGAVGDSFPEASGGRQPSVSSPRTEQPETLPTWDGGPQGFDPDGRSYPPENMEG